MPGRLLYLYVTFTVWKWNLIFNAAQGFDLIQRIKPNVNTSLSSTYDKQNTNWISINAIDDKYSGDPNSCGCCSATNGTEFPWWEINLGGQYVIDSVTIIGRQDGSASGQYSDLWIFVGDTSMQRKNGSLVYHGNPNNGTFTFSLHENFPRVLQYLIIKKFVIDVMTICEVKLTVDITLLPNLKTTAQSSQSSIFLLNTNNYTSVKAIDGQDDYDVDHCGCCSVTNGSIPSWWQIDLKNKYLIGAIEVFGRKSGEIEQLQNARILGANSTINGVYSVGLNVTTIHLVSPTEQHFLKILDSATIFQYLSIVLDKTVLTICEFRLFTKKCKVGKFGNGCALNCHCFDRLQCDTVNGECKTAGCFQGWAGLACDTCSHGHFGENCNQTCHCKNDSECNRETGHCQTGCAPGWHGDSCNQACSHGQFGENCNQICHCKNNGECDRETGHCETGCAPGWHGDSCSQACSHGHFGENCNQTCHCKNDSECNRETGHCQAGCAPGWHKDSCNQDLNLILQLRNSVITNQSSVYHNASFNSSKAIDGVENYNVDSCACCSVTYGTAPSWWQIDLLKQYLIGAVEVFGRRTGSSGQLNNSIILAGNTTLNGDLSIGINISTIQLSSENDQHVYKKLDFPIIAQFLAVVLNQTTLTICEFRLFNHVCSVGTFGNGCFHRCHCSDGLPCESVTGHCQKTGCFPGWQGISCDEACEEHMFGNNCSKTCHCTSCDPVNGTCYPATCDSGWQGEDCSQECNMGTFGAACSFDCHCANRTACNNVNGTCKVGLCDSGWLGQNCSIGCSASSFGVNCSRNCYCMNKVPCNNTNGVCPSGLCDPGWKGDSCDSQCSHGYFGDKCSSICHCVNGTECDHVSGSCDKSRCDPGWMGYTCSEGCEADSFGENCSRTCHCLEDSCDPVNGTCTKLLLGCKPGWQGEACETLVEKRTGQDSSVALAGGTSAAIIVVAIAVLIGFFLYRRHKSRSTNQDSAKKFSHLDEALRQKQQRRAESHSSRRVAGNDSSAYIETNVDDKSYAKEQTGAEDTGGGYYDFAEVVGIRINELWDYIHEKTKNECEQLYGEFKKLPSGLIHSCTIAEQLANRGKNRYREMYAYDHTRVILEEKNDKGTDYVNANYIDGYNITRKFVACQGPTKQTIEDFWRMIWQLKSDKIVMLTNLVEQGATKCVLYWPKDEEFSYGKVNVKIVKLDTDLDFDVRHLDVWKEGESPRRIRQYHFKSWPDKDVPDSTWCLLKFWRAVQTDAKSKAGPVIVHCSAGVGRTGTFIALDNLIHQARDEGCVRPFQVVRSLREQRINMVQTKEQYVYLHEVLADALCFGTHFVWSTQFEAVYMSLLQKEDGEAKTRLEVQYDLIQHSLKNTVSKEAEAAEYSNMEMILSESDAYRPKLKKRGSKVVQQLGATLIQNYDGRNIFLVAMSPDKSTIEEFWSLVDDLNIKTVVMLTEKSSTCYKASCDLGSHNDNGTKFHVNKVEENIRKGHTERTFTFKESHREEEDHLATVKQFEYTAWKDGYVVPGDARSLVDFLEAIFKWQSHFSESQPVLIYDGDGCSRSGILCVALNEVQRIKTEGGHINIVQSVKMMKQRKPQLIHSFDQYKFCYELILAYLKQTEVYQNLK